MRQRTRSTGKDLLSGPENNTRQFVALALALILAVLLIPVGVQAAQTVSAIITDPGGTNQAVVDSSGNLQVGGTVAIDSSTPVATTSGDDPGRMVFQEQGGDNLPNGDGTGQFNIEVPEGKRAVIQHISGLALLPTAQVPFLFSVSAITGGGDARHHIPMTFVASTAFGDRFEASNEITLYADPGTSIQIRINRSNDTGLGTFSASLSGYLIDCSVAACN